MCKSIGNGKPVSMFVKVAMKAAIMLVIAIIWVPWIAYNNVPVASIGQAVIDQARTVPDDGVFAEFTSYDIGYEIPWKSQKQLVDAADKMLQGQIVLPGFPAVHFDLDPDARSMASGSGKWQLFIQGLGLPKILVDAYQVTGRPEFLHTAADYLLAYEKFEGNGWKPGGYIWNDSWKLAVRNDHAIAARIPVLAEFWRNYRNSSGFSSNVADAVFRLVQRCAYQLADPSKFTFATNHGLMQNLGLLGIALMFPTLPGAGNYERLAGKRLEEQLSFLISDEGYLLEHSPGYQQFDIRLIGIAFRLMTRLEIRVPKSLKEKYEAALVAYANMRRPDGTLPVFGDTDGGADLRGPQVTVFGRAGRAGRLVYRKWSVEDPFFLAPVAGYCVWWNGRDAGQGSEPESQTAVSWSYFKGMGHKHADEMSLTVWADGTPWWTNVGYWPYDSAERAAAESWDGSDAPHYIDEPNNSQRKTRLRYYGRGDRLTAIDLEREGSKSYRVRRQVVYIRPGMWIVIDTSTGEKGLMTRTVWTTSPRVKLSEDAGTGEYTLMDTITRLSMRAFFTGAPKIMTQPVKGSHSPFAGWTVEGGMIRSSPAIIVEQPADGSWALDAWSVASHHESNSRLTGKPEMIRWDGSEEWDVMLPTAGGPLHVIRHNEKIEVVNGKGRDWSLDLVPGPDVSMERNRIANAYGEAAGKYGTADMSGLYRLKVTLVLLVLLFLNFFIIRYSRRFRRHPIIHLGIYLDAGWILVAYYFICIRAQLV